MTKYGMLLLCLVCVGCRDTTQTLDLTVSNETDKTVVQTETMTLSVPAEGLSVEDRILLVGEQTQARLLRAAQLELAHQEALAKEDRKFWQVVVVTVLLCLTGFFSFLFYLKKGDYV